MRDRIDWSRVQCDDHRTAALYWSWTEYPLCPHYFRERWRQRRGKDRSAKYTVIGIWNLRGFKDQKKKKRWRYATRGWVRYLNLIVLSDYTPCLNDNQVFTIVKRRKTPPAAMAYIWVISMKTEARKDWIKTIGERVWRRKTAQRGGFT